MAIPNRILVVEDDHNARSALAELFEELGYEVFSAGDGLEGLQLLARLQPDVVLTDVQMPRLDGVALLNEGRQIAPDARFIVMTAYDTPHTVEAVSRGGAFDYLVKPLDLFTAERSVADALRHRSSTCARSHAPG